jgi:putative sterol carrier protein
MRGGRGEGMSQEELRAIFAEMPKRFKKGAIEKKVSFYFSLGEGPGEKWTVVVGPDACDVKEGKHVESADCVLKTSGDFFLKMVRDGYTPGFLDFTRGKVKSNDPMLLQELKKAFAF